MLSHSAHSVGTAFRATRRCLQLSKRVSRFSAPSCASASSKPAKGALPKGPPPTLKPWVPQPSDKEAGGDGSSVLYPGALVELRCDALAFGGSGVCRQTDANSSGQAAVIMVPYALPGDVLVARIERAQGRHFEGERVALVSPGPDRVVAPCTLFGSCGGCAFQELSYGAQLAVKQQQVADALSKVGGFRAVLDPAPIGRAGRSDAGAEEAVRGGAGASSSGRTSPDEDRRPAVMIRPTVGSDRQYRYRNKTEFTVTRGPDGAAVVGLLSKGTSLEGASDAPGAPAGALVPVGSCHLQHEEADGVLATIRGFLAENARTLPPFDPQTGVGLLRRVMIRCSEPADAKCGDPPPLSATAAGTSSAAAASSIESTYSSGAVQIQVDLCTAFHDATSGLGALAALLSARHPSVVSVVNTVDSSDLYARPSGGGGGPKGAGGGGKGRKAGAGAPASANKGGAGSGGAAGGFTRVLSGGEKLPMALGGLRFDVSPRAFFQVNSRQADALIRCVEEGCGLRPGGQDVLLDLFCGAGAIGLCLAKGAKELHGWEIVSEAVRDARTNAERNGVANATFHLGDLKTAAAAIGKKVPDPDVIIVDPARAGMTPSLAAFLRKCKARRLVYVSCNPPTQARDLKGLCAEVGPGEPYRLLHATPVDMFPQTSHIEVVAVLGR